MIQKRRATTLSIIGLFGIWFIYSIWPIWSFFSPTFLFESHLLIVTNEAEQRPCGGFITAYGTLSFLPPNLSIHNAYSIGQQSLGPAPEKLRTVTDNLYFWDTAQSIDLNICTNEIADAYTKITDQKIDRIWLINTNVFINVLEAIGSIHIDNQLMGTELIFPYLSRLVANTDRHDETALSQRKNPLKTVIKDVIKKSLFSPLKWRKVLEAVAKSEKRQDLFIQNWSQIEPVTTDQIKIIEWNLGGGKTSNSLWSKVSIDARETSPQNWEINLVFSAKNLSGNDEPLGQTWSGQWDFEFPDAWNISPQAQSATIAPGETWNWEQTILYQGELNAFDIFVPRGQNLQGELTLSVYPQQVITSTALDTFSNTATWQGPMEPGRNYFDWQTYLDVEAPFLTMHKPIKKKYLSDELQYFFTDTKLIVEAHSNEKIQPDIIISAQLKDRNYKIPDVTEDITTNKIFIAPDQTTILLGFNPQKNQVNERFFLNINTLTDHWKNTLKANKNTVIIR